MSCVSCSSASSFGPGTPISLTLMLMKPTSSMSGVIYGPGPYVTPDIDDVGFMSIGVKLMGVPGPKLMDEEKFTQDMFGVSPPTFVTP